MADVRTFIGIILSAVKAFFSAIVQVVWGICTFFLLGALMTYYKVDTSLITELLKLVLFVQKNWIWFFYVLAIYDFIINFKEFLKPVYIEQKATTKSKEVKL